MDLFICFSALFGICLPKDEKTVQRERRSRIHLAELFNQCAFSYCISYKIENVFFFLYLRIFFSNKNHSKLN